MHGTASEGRRRWTAARPCCQAMTATKTDAPNAVEGTGYEKTVDYREVCYFQEHDDGRVTVVTIDGRGGDWHASVLDTLGDEEVGYVDIPAPCDREGALEAAIEWMEANPNGVDR